ncbi:adhesion G-protein coupled receptor G6-like [Diadema antillarum]|uniref:adhesion G-protein coupled receptor G6-like n=1 Tax=Diadema antillarum TaxID=105358 RepID=UPI003A8B4E03
MEMDIASLKEEVERLSISLKKAEEKVDDIENRNRRNNIVLFNVPEKAEGADCASFVNNLLNEAGCPDVRDAVQRARRSGKLSREQNRRPCPIHVGFSTYLAKEKAHKSLIEFFKSKRQSDHQTRTWFVSDGFSRRVQALRKEKLPQLIKLKKEGKFAFMVYPATIPAPSIVHVSGNQTGDPGDPVLLFCETSGSPSPIVSWQPQMGISQGSQDEPITTLSFTLQNGTDTTFTCSATNLAGMASAQVHVTARVTASCLRSEVSGAFGTLTFESTPIGETADSLESCQDYSRNTYLPRARRQCMGDLLSPAMWGELMISDCFTDNDDVNDVLQDLALAAVTPENVKAYSSDLAEATEDGNEIDASGLVAIATALSSIVAIRNSSSELTANVIRVVDNVLTVDNDEFVHSVEFEAPIQILYALEDQVTLFLTEGPGNNLTVIGKNLTVVALQLPKESLVLGLGFAAFSADGFRGDSRYFEKVVENGTMIYFDTEDIPRPETDASIYLPEGILDFLPQGKSSPYTFEQGTVPISFFVFKQSKLFQQYDIGPGRRLTVGTSVISATVEGVIIKGLPAGQEVETVFLERNVTLQGEQVDSRTCVFWEETSLGGRWSSEGCRREDLPDVDGIRCLCDHLTSFAVLLDISGDIGHRALDLLGIIGCVISIVCLAITIVTYLSMKKLRSNQPQQILLNLCLALFGLYFVFVIGIDRRYPTAGCVIVGLLIHYFLLASMCWMAVEAAIMYLQFVKVFNTHVSKFMLKACFCAWGLPLVVCIIIVASDHSMYLGDNTYCFVSPGPALYYGVLLLVAVLLLINFVIFALVLQRLTCRKTVAAHKADQGETWRRVQNAVAISALLGLTWVFGFLAIGGARIVFNILFLIFNSLQGFFVFVMFCLRQQEIRDQWRRWLHCQFGEEKPGQFRGEKVKAKPTPGSGTGSGAASGTRVTSEKSTNGSSLDPESIQLTSGGTLSTNAPSVSA